jgi:uncharacterized protein YjbI with pentapeptide repeats
MDSGELLERYAAGERDFRGAFLFCAGLSRATRLGGRLLYRSLFGAFLTSANLECVNLQGAFLTSANLQGANLQGANLQGAFLTSANLSGANLSGANLSGVNLRDADLSNVKVQKTQFKNNLGISEPMKLDLKRRGAVFPDSPGELYLVVTC